MAATERVVPGWGVALRVVSPDGARGHRDFWVLGPARFADRYVANEVARQDRNSVVVEVVETSGEVAARLAGK